MGTTKIRYTGLGVHQIVGSRFCLYDIPFVNYAFQAKAKPLKQLGI